MDKWTDKLTESVGGWRDHFSFPSAARVHMAKDFEYVAFYIYNK